MHLLPRMNIMFDFIWMGLVELRGTRKKRKLLNENACSQWDSNLRSARSQDYKSNAQSTVPDLDRYVWVIKSRSYTCKYVHLWII